MEQLTQPQLDAIYHSTTGHLPESHAMVFNDTKAHDALNRDVFNIKVNEALYALHIHVFSSFLN